MVCKSCCFSDTTAEEGADIILYIFMQSVFVATSRLTGKPCRQERWVSNSSVCNSSVSFWFHYFKTLVEFNQNQATRGWEQFVADGLCSQQPNYSLQLQQLQPACLFSSQVPLKIPRTPNILNISVLDVGTVDAPACISSWCVCIIESSETWQK